MQTTGAALLAIKRSSLLSMSMPAQSGHSAYRLLYLAAVWDDWRSKNAVKVALTSALHHSRLRRPLAARTATCGDYE